MNCKPPLDRNDGGWLPDQRRTWQIELMVESLLFRSTMSIPLPHEAVHVWYVRPEKVPETLFAHYVSLLPAEERARGQRYHFEKDRRLYLLARALVRATLSGYQAVAFAAWRFQEDAYGKPGLVPKPGLAPLCFNLSHTDGLIACAVTLERPVGVDVEHQDRLDLSMALARSYFGPAEVAHLDTLSPEKQQRTLFALWTLKESYIKARGFGLSLPLNACTFTLDSRGITFASSWEDEPGQWQFACHYPTLRHILSVAVRRTGADLAIVFQEIIPLMADLDVVDPDQIVQEWVG
jgi:4'-phosphopantetheinyl transferase